MEQIITPGKWLLSDLFVGPVDITSADFWQGGFDFTKNLITEPEGLPVQGALP